jgi:23S rRNA U2552 (ribose-2'-O)-methylase RlmE/FtsJ
MRNKRGGPRPHKAAFLSPCMESATAVKPPWVLATQAWQRRSRTPVGPTDLEFTPWQENDPFSATLQAAKMKISPLEESKRWELIKKMVNPYEMVYTHDDELFHPSIALIKPLSRSYFKMIEMMYVLQFFEQLPKQTPKIRTAHIAEGPGGFIQAITDLTERNKKILSQATAMTLKPTDQRVPGWRRAASFLHHHREVKLHYGVDGTGDVYQLGNQDSFVEAVAPGANLFTADGGFDFSINYTIQEQRVFHLLTCSATIGLRSLSPGGSFVLKVFDLFSEHTKILILLMSRCFKEWQLYKPALSRPCNSERYFLGRGFKGLPPSILTLLLQIQKESLGDRYPVGFYSVATEEETAYLESHIATNTKDQLEALTRADIYVSHPELWYTDQLPRDFMTCQTWCQTFRISTRFTKPLPLAVPDHLMAGYTSTPDADRQSRLPGDDSGSLVPSAPTLPTLSEDSRDQTPVP